VERSAAKIVREALAGTGIEAVASCSIEAYDARAPEAFRSTTMLPGARGLVVAASAGARLFRLFRERARARPSLWDEPHPYDAFVSETLDRADRALAAADLRFLRFDAAFHAPVRVDFVALAELAGMGKRGPFGLLISPVHGPWWALRGAWLVDAPVEPASDLAPPCEGCAAPCVGGWGRAHSEIAGATAESRLRCVAGQEWRYDADQIAYHYARADAVERFRRG
jgi:epoxyqueuosine reductase QueG